MPDELFGPLESFHDVEMALIKHIKAGVHTYLAARERKVGKTPGELQRPVSWIVKERFYNLPGSDRTPAIVVVSSGAPEVPDHHGDGGYDLKLTMAVAILAHGPESEDARALVGHYQAAILQYLVQHKKFGGGSARIHEWTDMGMEDIEQDLTRTLASCRLEFVVKVTDFASSVGGIKIMPSDDDALQPQLDDPDVHVIFVPTDLPDTTPARLTGSVTIKIQGGKTS